MPRPLLQSGRLAYDSSPFSRNAYALQILDDHFRSLLVENCWTRTLPISDEKLTSFNTLSVSLNSDHNQY